MMMGRPIDLASSQAIGSGSESGPAFPVPSLRVDRVSKSFGTVRVMEDLSLKVARGEFVSLLGPSGCGKTTLLRILSGFIEPDAGEIFIDGKPVRGVPTRKRDLGMVFQNYSLWPHMSVLQNVAFGLETRGVPATERQERATQALELVGLEDYGRRYPAELSGGQKQRVAIARAIVYEPRILLLDEPLSALDRKLRERMQVELRALQRRLGITAILVTHDQEEALLMSDRIAVMQSGRVHQIAAPQTIYDRPATDFVADFVGRMNFLEATVDHAEAGRIDLLAIGGFRWSIPFRDDITPGSVVRAMLRPERIGVSLDEASGGAAARVMETRFHGPLLYADCRLAGGPMITAALPRALIGNLAEGQQVWLRWDAADIHLLDTLTPRQPGASDA